MKNLLLVFLLLFACQFGFGQSLKTIDSLKHELAIAKNDTSRVLMIGELCGQYRVSKPDSSIKPLS